jgi:NAD(P)-dependent dehydrogenase (short-subunit alcohol dehydrogenase family)
MTGQVQGKVALVAGASGIGAAWGKRFARLDIRVANAGVGNSVTSITAVRT